MDDDRSCGVVANFAAVLAPTTGCDLPLIGKLAGRAGWRAVCLGKFAGATAYVAR